MKKEKKEKERNAEIALPDGPHSDNCVSIVGITVIIAGISVVRMKVFSISFFAVCCGAQVEPIPASY
jgi:hypothetical protein